MKRSDEKIKNFQSYMKRKGIDACAVTDLDGVNFFADFSFAGQGDAYLLITRKKAYCFTKQMYAADLKKKAPYLALVDSLDCADIVKKARSLKAENCVFDAASTGYLAGKLFYESGFKEAAGLISEVKEEKTASEISRIKKACAISAKAYDIFRKKLKAGISEIEAASLLEGIMSDLGGQGLAFTTIMAFGANSANPHHINSSRKLKEGEVVLLDYGCKYGGYCSDITRTFWFGKNPSAEFSKTFDLVKAAHDEALKYVKAGAAAKEAHNRVCEFFDKNGKLAKYFIHGLGHSLGTAIHETPYLNPRSLSTLKTGNIVTVEPGLYFEGKFGIRYENTVLITDKSVKILTK